MKQLNDINWNHLYYFYEAARLHSIKKVSELTQHSSSTISEQIKKLEQELGTQLFKRARSGLILTQKGENLFSHARVIFEEGYRVLEKFSSNEIGGYPITVGVDKAIPSPTSARIISNYWDLHCHYGRVNTVQQGDHDILIQNIIQENIDWGLSLTKSKRKTLASHKIAEYKLHLCCARHIYDRFKKKIEMTRYLPLVETAVNHPFKNTIDSFIRDSGLLFQEICHTDNHEYLLQLVKRGRALSLLPLEVIKLHKDLKVLNSDLSIEVPLYALWKIKNENYTSISTLKQLVENPNPPQPSLYYQLEVSKVPIELLKK